MSTVLPFGSNTLTVYSYESFSYTLSNPNSNLYTLSLSNSAGILPGYISNYGNAFVVFSSASNTMQAGTQAFVVSAVDASGTVVQSSSNTVSVQAGRLLDSSGASLAGSNYTFYAKEAITPIKIVAPFSLAPPTVTPSFPPGLTFTPTDGTTVFISGTPLTTLPQSNYLIIARQANGSKIATARIGMVVSNERIAVSVDGGQVISQMKQDTQILPRTMTTRANGVVRYTWSNFPDGIVVTDVDGTIQPPSTYGFTPVDASHTIVIRGAPSFAAIMDFKDKGYLSGFTTSVLVERLSPLPVLSSNVPITFAFGEAVLFDQSFITVPTTYAGVTLDPSANYMRAQTYFTSNVAITSMSANVPAPPGLAFVYNGIDRLYLTGTPTSAPFGYTYTISASNANSIQAPGGAFDITVSNDSVSFTTPTPVDTCYNFVLSRPLTLSLSGYYPTPVEVRAIAASGKAVTITAPALAGTGLSLSNVGNSTVRIVGTPSALLPLQAVTFQATVSGSPATGSTDVSLAIVADTFTISGSALTGIQNKAITPLQYTASTLSGRPVVSFSSQDLPAGLSLSPTGLLTGTPTAATTTPFTITASTGYATGSQAFSTTINPDNIVVAMVNDTETVGTVFSGVEFRALTYSGKEGTLVTGGNAFRVPIQRTQFDVSFASDGISLGGNFSGLPGLLPAYRFKITGTAGSYVAESPVNVAVTNPSTFVRMLGGLDALSAIVPPTPSDPSGIPVLGTIAVRRNTGPPLQLTNPLDPTSYQYEAATLSTWTTVYSAPATPWAVGDVARSGSTAVVVAGSNLARSTDDGATWTAVPASNVAAIDMSGGPQQLWPPYTPYRPVTPLFACVATNGASEWVALANGFSNSTDYTVIRKSVDNGVTWTDFSTSSITTLDSNSRLYSNGSRYFLVSSNVWTAEASNLTTWTAATGLTGTMRAMAFSNSTILLIGSNAGTNGYTSSNNGTTWAPLPTSPIPTGGDTRHCNVAYAGGLWGVSGLSNGFSAVAFSSNLSTWSAVPVTLDSGAVEVLAEDGGAWQITGRVASWKTGVWDSTGAITFSANTTQSLGSSNKTFLAYPTSSGTPSLTLSIPFLGSNFAWVSPTTTSYTFWQFVSNTPITVKADSSSATFLYYYASGLPDGLDLSLDSVGSQATIQGTSVAYSDAFKRVLLYANDGTSTLRLQLGMRTILPTVTKQQTSAGAWTSLVRQYTTVNAAQNARDQRVFAAVDRTLGEFTAPYPPDVVTQVSSNCQC
jgi:hypothetical protein